ncbi:MAG: Nif3-like dinuclear metal center hexameric protein [Armatimonadota bacterium]
MRIREIGEYLENILPPDLLAENRQYTPMSEDGLRFGDDGGEVRGVMICWMATATALRDAASRGCNVIICHEDPYYQAFGAAPEISAGWLANRERLRLLIEGNMTLYRCHSPLDVLYNTDAALDALGLEIEELYSEWIARVAVTPTIRLSKLVTKVRAGFGVHEVRVVGDTARLVTNIGISVGGMGLSFNGSFNEWLRRRGAEVIVTGEVDDYGAFWAEESGIALISVGHPASENPGIRRFSEQFARDFSGQRVFFHECKAPFRMG